MARLRTGISITKRLKYIVCLIQTTVCKMKTMFKPSIWKILGLFYENRNQPLHLREIARRAKLNESTISVHLSNLAKQAVLKIETEANLKKFYVDKTKIPEIFPLFDYEKIEALPLLRRDAIKLYIKKLERKPLLLLVFGSTAKGTYSSESDIDILEVTSEKNKDEPAKDYVEAQTGIRIQAFRINEKQFMAEIKSGMDKVIQSALQTGIPVFNAKYYYEAIYNE